MTTLLPSLTGKSTSLPDWRSDKKLTALHERRARVVERSAALAAGIERAQHELAAAVEKDRQAAAERLLGRSTESPLAAAAAESALAGLQAEQREVERKLAAFDAALDIVEREAMTAAAAGLTARYRGLVQKLDEALGQASRLAEEVELTYAAASGQFDGTDGRAEAAGLPLVKWPDLALPGQYTRHGNPNPSALERFRAMLAERGW